LTVSSEIASGSEVGAVTISLELAGPETEGRSGVTNPSIGIPSTGGSDLRRIHETARAEQEEFEALLDQGDFEAAADSFDQTANAWRCPGRA
jgi:hypothetical protein